MSERPDTDSVVEQVVRYSGARFLFVAACFVVVVAGLRVAAPILIPAALAIFLGVLSLPIMFSLQRRGVPALLAILVSVLADIAVFGLVILLSLQSVPALRVRAPLYWNRLNRLWTAWLDALEGWGAPIGRFRSIEFLDWNSLFDLAGSTLQGVASFLGSTFIVVLIMVFMLAEAWVFPQKFRVILGPRAGSARRVAKIVGEVQEYLLIKTLVSLATGVLIGLWAWYMNLDFPVLLGVIGFVLNYAPTVGSALASLPAMLLAVVQYSVPYAMIVGGGYAVINVVFGNFIEPHLMGRRLGLSTLVVILSLIFWGWVWGAVGMLLAVPLTMVAKIMLENTDDLRWIAVLIDKAPWENGRGAAVLADASRAPPGGGTPRAESILPERPQESGTSNEGAVPGDGPDITPEESSDALYPL